jgi:hypothetical protein
VSTPNTRTGASPNLRRSQRIRLAVSILITGKRANEAVFTEKTTTAVVNAHGALIFLREPVLVGDLLTMTNIYTKEEMICEVIDINLEQTEVPEVGVEFTQACPRFWRVSFPPADWSPRSPEAKRYVHGQGPATVTKK